jgi:hypothetical protein
MQLFIFPLSRPVYTAAKHGVLPAYPANLPYTLERFTGNAAVLSVKKALP